jgi:cytochrome oxidase Cu insertion factor (SCO1/SenC/PrrC family)
MKKRYILVPVLVLLACLLVFYPRVRPGTPAPGEVAQGTVVSTGEARIGGAFNLNDDDGNPVSEQSLIGGKYTLIFFGFTNCPDVCPAMLQMMADTMSKLPQATQDKLNMVFVSVDPKRDDAGTLKAYVDGFDPRFTGWTGTKEQVDDMTRKYLAYYAVRAPQNPSETDVYQVDHSSYLYLMGPNGKYITHFSNKASQSELLEKLTQLTQ